MRLKMSEEWHAAATFFDPFYTVYPVGLRCFWGFTALCKEQFPVINICCKFILVLEGVS